MLPTVVSPVCLAGSLTPNGSFFPAYYSSNTLMLKKFFGQCKRSYYDLLARVKPS